MNKEINIQGLKINYKQKGKGEAIVILHGWGGSSKSWEKVIEFLSNNNYMVVCPDLPGFGESDDPKQAWNINKYICFVLDFLNVLKIDEFILLGHSFGGGLSTKITAKNPRIGSPDQSIGTGKIYIKKATALLMAEEHERLR